MMGILEIVNANQNILKKYIEEIFHTINTEYASLNLAVRFDEISERLFYNSLPISLQFRRINRVACNSK